MNEKLHEVMEQISDKHLSESVRPRRRRPWWIGAVAAALVLVITISFFLRTPGDTNLEASPPVSTSSAPNYLQNLVAAPQYPELVRLPDYDSENYAALYSAWASSQRAQYNQPKGYADSLTPFFDSSIRQFLTGQENAVYAPLNVYMALAMLAETTGGNSRQQILDLLGADSIEDLRTQAGYVWNAHYSADGRSDLLLANSLWLDNAYSFRQDTVNILASDYYASSFCGDLGTEEMDGQLRRWLNENTGELLYDQIQDLSMDPETVFALASTVFFAARWESQFSKDKTEDAVFHAPDGDRTVSFMNRTTHQGSYFWGSNFGAIRLELSGDNDMWLILPDEGVTVAQVLESDEYLQMTLNPSQWENKKYGLILHISIPKFDVSGDLDLISGMQALGVTDVFDSTAADFSPLTDADDLAVTSVKHAARVAIDEEGCVGAAYTVIFAAGAMQPDEEVYFTLDRPFLFVVTSRDSLPIFVGTVTNP